MNTDVAHGARLKLLILIMECGSASHVHGGSEGVALQAKQIRLAMLEQARVHRTVRSVARHAAFSPDWIVLKDEWP